MLSDKIADVQYSGLTSSELSFLLNDSGGAESSPQIAAHNVNAKEVLSVLGASAGAVFLDALEVVAPSNSAVKWMLSFLKSEAGVNVGDVETRASLDALVSADVLAADSVDAIKALADSSISWAQANGVTVDPVRIQKLRGEV